MVASNGYRRFRYYNICNMYVYTLYCFCVVYKSTAAAGGGEVGKCAEGCVRPHNNTAPVRALRGPSPSSDRTSAPTPPLGRRTGSPTWKTIVKWSAAPMFSFSTPREQQVTVPATCARLDDRLPDREKTARRRRSGFPAIFLARVPAVP